MAAEEQPFLCAEDLAAFLQDQLHKRGVLARFTGKGQRLLRRRNIAQALHAPLRLGNDLMGKQQDISVLQRHTVGFKGIGQNAGKVGAGLDRSDPLGREKLITDHRIRSR